MMKDTNKPLVSVCVVTYNSAGTIIETLDSICAQTYPELELIVSDDCSKDNTVELCSKWIDGHKERFVHASVLVAEKNGGPGKNNNRAISCARGEWIKSIAGDDLLFPDCISDNVEFVSSHPDVIVALSRARIFKTIDGRSVVTDEYMAGNVMKQYCTLSAEEQYKKLLYSNFVPGVTIFIKREFVQANPFPEVYPYLEDWPYWLRLTKKGVRPGYFEKDTVLYRVGNSLRSSDSGSFVCPRFFDSVKAFFYAERYPALMELDPSEAHRFRKEFLLGEIAVVLLKNRRNLFSRSILMLFKMLLGVKKLP